MTAAAGLLDTSVVLAGELGRTLDRAAIPAELSISVITLAELLSGVHTSPDIETRARRLAALDSVSSLEALQVDEAAAREWARMRARLREAKRGANINDLWIAAIAVSRGLPVITQDGDFDVLSELGGPVVIRV